MTLRELRTELNLTLKQMSEELDMALSSLCKYERGDLITPKSVIQKVYETFGVEIESVEYKTYAALKQQVADLEQENKELRKQVQLLKLNKKAIIRAQNLLKKVEEVYDRRNA